jgi:type IV pilus assembly protein PilW
MIAMLLGLMVVGAAIAIFQSNRQAYSTTQSLGRIQESSQVAFELMARDIREAGGNPCDIGLPVANVVNGFADNWWTNWSQPLIGLDNGAVAGTRAGTDVIRVLSMGDEVVNVTGHSGTSLEVDSDPFDVGDVLMVCDIRQLAIFVASSAGADEIGHAASGGNCSDSLNTAPAACSPGAPPYLYPGNSVVGRLQGVQWLVRDNGRGSSSLYRSINGGDPEEVTEGISDMQITYLQPDLDADEYVSAGAITDITDWLGVRAVRIVLTLTGAQGSGADGNPIQRQVEHVVNLRNRTL